eukprot:5968466-Heterocapsa_arctica.AAC.1
MMPPSERREALTDKERDEIGRIPYLERTRTLDGAGKDKGDDSQWDWIEEWEVHHRKGSSTTNWDKHRIVRPAGVLD